MERNNFPFTVIIFFVLTKIRNIFVPTSRSLWVVISLLLIMALLFPIVQTLFLLREVEIEESLSALEHFEQGLEFLEAEEYSLAYAEFHQAVSKDTEFVDGYFERGKLLLMAGEPGLANANLSYVISLDPDHAAAYYYRALSYQALGDLISQAAKELETSDISIELKESGLFSIEGFGDLQPFEFLPEVESTKQFDIEQFSESEMVNFPEPAPDSLAVNPYNASLNDFSSAINADPKYKDAYLARAYLLFGVGDYLTVIDDLSKVIELDPEISVAYNLRALSYYSLEKFILAVDDFDQYIAIGEPTFDTYYHLGVSHFLLEDFEAAIEAWTNAADIDAENVAVFTNIG